MNVYRLYSHTHTHTHTHIYTYWQAAWHLLLYVLWSLPHTGAYSNVQIQGFGHGHFPLQAISTLLERNKTVSMTWCNSLIDTLGYQSVNINNNNDK